MQTRHLFASTSSMQMKKANFVLTQSAVHFFVHGILRRNALENERKSRRRHSMNETASRAMATARERAKTLDLDPEKYEMEMTEEAVVYVVFLIAKDKPQGFRGALAELPEPVFRIEKSSGAIVEKHFER